MLVHHRYPTAFLSDCTLTILLVAFRVSSYEPGNWAGPVSGTDFVFCSYGKFQFGYQDEQGTARLSSFIPVTRLGCSYGKISSLVVNIFGRKNQDLGNRASPVDGVHVKRYLIFLGGETL